MDQNKTIMLRFKPIDEITEDEMKEDVVATNGTYWMRGRIDAFENNKYECMDEDGTWIEGVTHYAGLPKDE